MRTSVHPATRLAAFITPRGVESYVVAASLAAAAATGCSGGSDLTVAVGHDGDSWAEQRGDGDTAPLDPRIATQTGDVADGNHDRKPGDTAASNEMGVEAAQSNGQGAGFTSSSAVGPGTAIVSAHNGSMLGYNMDFPGDWTNAPPFIDQMKNARAVVGQCSDAEPDCDGAAHLSLDAAGWPTTLRYRDDPSRSYSSVYAILNTSEARSDLGQTFVVTWSGSGDLQVDGATDVRQAADHRLTFRLEPGVTLLRWSNIDSSDSGDYLRNIQVFRENHEQLLAAGEVFNPDLVDYLKPFGSVRFMDWMLSNEGGQCRGGAAHGRECFAQTDESCGADSRCVTAGVWDERPLPNRNSLLAWSQYLDTARPGEGTRVGGYSVEVLVALANRVGSDPHFNMPTAYEDDYVRNFAQYVRDNLGDDLVASVEYSNEVWNWGFPQSQYANTLGGAAWPGEGSAWVQYSAARSARLCDIWKDVFTGEEDRLRCLISPQTGWHDLAETVLECPSARETETDGRACYESVDAINITGYFDGCLPGNPDIVKGWLAEGHATALDKAFEQLEHGSMFECDNSLANTLDSYAFFGDLADQYGLELYVYEGGTHFEYKEDDEVQALLVDMTKDPRMYDLYSKNFETFVAAGGSTFNVWGWVAPKDAWANSESLSDRAHPKYEAIVDFAAGH